MKTDSDGMYYSKGTLVKCILFIAHLSSYACVGVCFIKIIYMLRMILSEYCLIDNVLHTSWEARPNLAITKLHLNINVCVCF